MSIKERLMIPGPTPTPPEVVAAATTPMADERTAEFAAVFTRTVGNLQRLLGTANDVLVFTASITGSFESVLQNLFSPGDRILVLNNGAFGDRWVKMCTAYGLDVVELSAPWGYQVPAAAVEELLSEDSTIIAAICVHCETSTGVVADLQSFGRATRRIISIVDSASGLGACDLRADEWGLDVVVGGSQKALMTPPGISFVSVSQAAWRQHESARIGRFYFDWDQAVAAYRAEIPRTPWTPAIGVLVQLDAALELLLEEGLTRVLGRHVALGRVARAGLLGMGLNLMTPDRDECSAVTTAYLPDGVEAAKVVLEVVERYGVRLATGCGALEGTTVRLGHCGYVDGLDVVGAVAALDRTLYEMKVLTHVGEGTAAAVRALEPSSNQTIGP